MAKKKQLTQLEKDGFKLVPETVGRIIDSIWINEETQVLKVKFATGQTLTFQPLENDLVLL